MLVAPRGLAAAAVEPDAIGTLLDGDTRTLAAFTRWLSPRGEPHVAGGPPEALAESSLRLGGMRCAACADTIELALRRVPGVVQASVSAATQIGRVRWDPARTRPSALIAAVHDAGYDAVPDTAMHARAQRGREARTALWRLFVAAFCSMQIMMLAAPAYFAAPGELAADQKRLLDAASWMLTLPVLWFSAAPFFAGACSALRAGRIAMDVPVALGVAVAFGASSVAAFDPGGVLGDAVYFDSLTMFIAFLLGGRCIEQRVRHHAEVELERATDKLPQAAWRVAADGRVETVAPDRLCRGDRLRVPVGQAFAADGVLLSGRTQVDESLLTGEGRTLDKGPGDAVVAGSVNLGAPVEMRAEQVGADTRYEAIVALMRAARADRPALLALADRWAAPFIWTVLALAALAALAWSFIDPTRVVWVAVSVLIVTCPCALSLAAPSALAVAAAAMGRRGLLLRRLDAIQTLACMQVLFVDKTGTLTDGATRGACVVQPTSHALPHRTADVPTLCRLAAALAAWSSHPLAATLRASVNDVSGTAPPAEPPALRDARETAGEGVEAWDSAGRRWRLGSARWAGAPECDGQMGDAAGDPESTRVWLGVDGMALAGFAFDERLRRDASSAVQALRHDGVEVRLLSGDAPPRVQRVAQRLGIATAAGGLSPSLKLAALRAAQRDGTCVAMLGDGINDAPVLAQADLSIAMGEGAAIARGHADAVLVTNRLDDLIAARGLARRTLRVVRQNFVWAAAYNAACIPVAMAGWLPPWLAGVGMAASSLVVVLNSARLAR